MCVHAHITGRSVGRANELTDGNAVGPAVGLADEDAVGLSTQGGGEQAWHS